MFISRVFKLNNIDDYVDLKIIIVNLTYCQIEKASEKHLCVFVCIWYGVCTYLCMEIFM